jgi:GNAT superfamily N-acetyltransferase
MDRDGVILRPAVEADLDVVADIWYEGASLPGVGPVALPPVSALRSRIDDELAEGWDLTIAEQQGEVAGFIALRCDQAVLDQLFVRPASAGKGIGRALFAQAKVMMPDGFSLFTRPGNARARRFYAAQGMRVLRHEIHPRFGDAIVFYGWAPA